MAKIVIDARESGTTTGRYVDKMIEYLEKINSKHELVILAKSHRLDYFRKLTPRLEIIESNFKEFTFAEQLGLKKHIERLKADLVHFPMVQQPVWYKGKVVTTMQDLTSVRFKNPAANPAIFFIRLQVYKWVNKKVAKKSVEIISPTDFVRKDVIAYTGQDPKKFFVTYEAADFINDTPEAMPDLKEKHFIMYVGRPTPHKNLERLIEAFVILKDNKPNLILVLAGKKDQNYQRIEDMIQEKNIRDVMFTDFVSEGQLRWLYENCQAYIFPSLSEGFGLPGLEAMVHGAPVVSSDATCLPEVYGDAAQYFDPLDIGNMASVISKVLNDNKLRSSLIEKGYARLKHFSWKRMAEQTLEVYEKALNS